MIVYLPNWLGDMVMATPFLKSLRLSFSGEIWALGKMNSIKLYNGMDFFDRFIPYDKKGVVDFFDVVCAIKEQRFDIGLILPHSMRSALLFYLSSVRERIGYARNKRGFMLTKKVRDDIKPESTVEHYLKILDVISIKRQQTHPVLKVTDEEESKYIERFGHIHEKYIAFIPGAHYGPSKRWPKEYFVKLAELIYENMGIKIYILPGNNEIKLSEDIKNSSKYDGAIEIRYLDLSELKVCLSKAIACVSNDTGPRHISSALSVPTFVLYGSMDERYTDYPSHWTFKFISTTSCRPCNKKICNRNLECLYGITPQEVYKKLEEVIGKKGV